MDKYKSYDRIHKFDNPSDVEKGKIKRESSNYKKINKKTKLMSKQFTQNYHDISDEMYEDYEALLYSENRQKKTAKGHKNRLHSLSKRDDFY